MQATKLLYIASLLLSNPVSGAGSSTWQQITITDSLPTLNRIKVPGESPAYFCSDPSNDLFKIRRLDFIPTNPRM